MKPDGVRSWLSFTTGQKIDKQTLIYWEKEGLLGEVPRIEVKNKKETTKLSEPRRDYSSFNISRVLITLVLRNAGWGIHDIKKVYEKDALVLDQANKVLDTIERGFIPAIKEARRIL